MEQKTISESHRFVPIALAVVLLATLGLLALRVNAEETAEVETMTREQMGDREAQQDFIEERKQNEDMSVVLYDKAYGMKEELQLRKIDREKLPGGFKAKFSEQKQERLGQFVERIALRMNTAIDRLEQIADRVLKRIEETERKKDSTLLDARNELEKVYIAIYDAREFVTLFVAISTDAFSSENPSAQAEEIRNAAKFAKEAMQYIHTTLSNTVQLIKASEVSEESTLETSEVVEEDVEVTE